MPVKVPKLCRFKPRNLACVWITPTRRLYLGPWGSPESHELYAEVVRRLLLGETVTEVPKLAPGGSVPTIAVGQLAAKYVDHARAYYIRDGVPTGEFPIIELAVSAATAHYAALPADQFGPLCLEDVRNRLIDAGLARSTINGRTRRIVAMFRWAAAKQLVPATVPAALSMLAGLRAGRSAAREPVPVRPVEDAVVEATILELPELVADMVRFQRLTGCRPGEACSLRPRDVDRTGDVWLYRLGSHKTAHHGKQRTVFIGPKAQVVLLRYLARDPDAYCFRPCDSEAKRRAALHDARVTPLSCGNRPGTNVTPAPTRLVGERYKKDTYARAIARAAKRAGVEHWTPNQLRHTCATTVRRDHGLEAAQVILGHSGAKTTEIYAERDAEKGAAVARLIG